MLLRFVCFRKYYKQTFGTAMGLPVSVTVANLVMEEIEETALSTFPTPLRFWKNMLIIHVQLFPETWSQSYTNIWMEWTQTFNSRWNGRRRDTSHSLTYAWHTIRMVQSIRRCTERRLTLTDTWTLCHITLWHTRDRLFPLSSNGKGAILDMLDETRMEWLPKKICETYSYWLS